MHEKILICTDLDRTLLPNGKQPESQQSMSWFTRFCQQDHVILVYVSGRDKRLLLQAIEEFGIPVPDYAIGDVGTSIYHIIESRWKLDPQWSAIQESDWGGRHRRELQALLSPISELSPQEEEKQNTFKLSYYAPMDLDAKAVITQMHELLDAEDILANIIWSIDEEKKLGLIDVLPRAANKLEAIRYLNTSLEIPLERTLFSGDSGNDLSVLSSEVPAVLVANAAEDVRQEAIQLAQQHNVADRLYIAHGNFYGMNGNYSAGILEGIHHYLSDCRPWFESHLGETSHSSSSS